MVDNEYFHGASIGCELQPELFLNSGEDRRGCRISRRAGIVKRSWRAVPGKLQMGIKQPCQPGLGFDDRSVQSGLRETG